MFSARDQLTNQTFSRAFYIVNNQTFYHTFTSKRGGSTCFKRTSIIIIAFYGPNHLLLSSLKEVFLLFKIGNQCMRYIENFRWMIPSSFSEEGVYAHPIHALMPMRLTSQSVLGIFDGKQASLPIVGKIVTTSRCLNFDTLPSHNF